MRTVPNILLGTLLACVAVPASYAQNPSSVTPGAAPSSSTANAAAIRHDAYDPLLDLPPLPPGKVTLIGGTVASVDEVMNRMVIQPFAAKQKMRVRFDTRTHFYRDGKPIGEREIRQGERVYLDTQLNGDRVFAKTIWIRSSADEGIGRGQIAELDIQRKTLTVRDELSDQPVRLQISPTTTVKRGNQPAQLSDLAEGALVALSFGPQKEIREITLLASPGTAFTFGGRVTYLDLSRKLIAIDNRSDGKKYDVSMDAIAPNIVRQLHEGVNVTILAVFDGQRYAARSVDIQTANAAPQPQ